MKQVLRKLLTAGHNLVSTRPITDRPAFLRQIDTDHDVLEIGPFTNPSLRGPTVSYFDVLDRASLLDRAQAEYYAIADPGQVPEIDFVSPQGDLSVVTRRFANAYSSHCIEHQPDLVRHLRQVAALLEPGGHYYLVIPDKRYCFDALLPVSTIASVLEAHEQKRTIHSMANVLQHYALTTHNISLLHWLGQHGSSRDEVRQLRRAQEKFTASQGAYIDVHAWLFTPHSFISIINWLQQLGYINFTVETAFYTAFGSNEFYVVLRKTT